MRFFSDLASLILATSTFVANRADRKTAAITFAAAAVLLALVLVSITQKPSPSHPSSVSVASTYWRLVEWAGQRSTLERPIRLNFSRGEWLSGRGTCNDFSGNYARIGSIFEIKAEVHAVRNCEASAMEIDRRFVADLGRVTQFAIDKDGMLNARDGAGTILFRFRGASNAYDD